MSRFKLVSIAFAAAISIISTAIILSCSVDLDKKDGESSDSGGNSGEGFCIYAQTQECFPTSEQSCPAGGERSDFCPYSPVPLSSAETPNVTPSSSSRSGICNIASGYCLYSGPNDCWPMPTDDCCEYGTIVANQAACSSTAVKFCNWGTCVGGNGLECNGGGGCYPISNSLTEASCRSDSGAIVDCCPANTRPPSANYPQCSVPSSSSVKPSSSSSSSVNKSSSSGSGVCNITSGYCLYSGPNDCWPMPTDDCCEYGTIVPNQAACSSTAVKFCNFGTCVGGNGWECSGSGGCFTINNKDTEANCISSGAEVVDCCPVDTRPPSATNYPQCSISNSSLLWDLSIHNTGISTGGGWFNFYDKNEAENPGNSFSVFYDKISEGYVNQGEPQNNGYPTPVDLIDWSGEVSFYLDNTGEYPYAPYAGIGFVWVNGSAAPQVFGSHTGLCVEYSLNGGGDYNLQFNIGDYAEWNDFRITFPKQASVGKKFFDFSLFRQQEGWGKIISLSEAKAHSIGMSIQGNLPDTYSGPPQEGTLVIKSIYWDSCNY